MLDHIVVQLVISFIATACFGVVFNVPTRAIPACGLVGAVGWIIYYSLVDYGLDDVRASLLTGELSTSTILSSAKLRE